MNSNEDFKVSPVHSHNYPNRIQNLPQKPKDAKVHSGIADTYCLTGNASLIHLHLKGSEPSCLWIVPVNFKSKLKPKENRAMGKKHFLRGNFLRERTLGYKFLGSKQFLQKPKSGSTPSTSPLQFPLLLPLPEGKHIIYDP